MKRSVLFIITFAATAFCACSCVNSNTQGSIPADKKEIIDRFLDGTLDPSYTPALFFGHFGSGQKLGEGAVQAHLSLFLKGGADILKIQTEQPMPYVEDLSTDTPLVPEDWYRPTVEVIKEVLSYVGKDVYVMPTILSRDSATTVCPSGPWSARRPTSVCWTLIRKRSSGTSANARPPVSKPFSPPRKAAR